MHPLPLQEIQSIEIPLYLFYASRTSIIVPLLLQLILCLFFLTKESFLRPNDNLFCPCIYFLLNYDFVSYFFVILQIVITCNIMYAYIKGEFVEKMPTYVVLEDASGIGYHVNVSLNTYSDVKGLKSGKLLIHLIVKEDDMQLFGFSTEEERLMFRSLITVSGVGVNTARLILSSYTASEIASIILSQNVGALQKIKGLGAKISQRLILELKDKVTGGEKILLNHGISNNTSRNEALLGLTVLGFNKQIAEKALERVAKEHGLDLTVEQFVREALKVLR